MRSKRGMWDVGYGIWEKKSRKNFLYLLILLFIVHSLYSVTAWANSLDSIISRVQQTYEGIQDIKANFVQLTTSASIKETQRGEGIVYFKKPGMMRWEYKSPSKDIIVSDGKTIWAYQQDIGQVMTGSASTNGTSISNNFLSGMGNLNKDFDIALAKEDEAIYLLQLNPKVAQPNLKNILIAVDKKTFFVVKTIVHDQLGNETTVIFEGITINQSLANSIFKFKIPEGVKVIQ